MKRLNASLIKGDPISTFGPPGVISLQKLLVLFLIYNNKKWCADLSFDPNDPRNQEIIKLKQLIFSLTDPHNPLSLTFYEYLNKKNFFRNAFPNWLMIRVFGVGVITLF